MIEEVFGHRTEEMSLSIVQSQIQSIRNKNIQKNALRLYDNETIGISANLGEFDKEQLKKTAMEKLKYSIPYKGTPAGSLTEQREDTVELSDPDDFCTEMEAMLKELAKNQPNFSFSHKCNLTRNDVSLRNSEGLDIAHTYQYIAIELAIKEKKSANIMDAFSGYRGFHYERKEFLRLTNSICNAFQQEVAIEEGRYRIFFLREDYAYQLKLLEALNGLLYGSGASIYSGKLNQRIFNSDLTLYQSRNMKDGVIEPFFDMEGTVNTDDRFALIKNGELVAPYTHKKYALQYNLPLTGAAGGEYDEVPDLSRPDLIIESKGKTMAELADGKKSIFVLIASGGDFTPEGKFASPVQLAFLFDGEKFLGKIPEVYISSHIDKMLGSDFAGVSADSLTSLAPMPLIAMDMNVKKG